MSEEKQSNEATPSQTTAGASGSAGERLDQFISGAKRLTNVAANKAKDFADAAAPRIKQIGDATTQHVSQAVNRQQFAGRGGPALEKALALYHGVSGKQKRIALISIGAFMIFMIALIPILIHATSGPGPTASNLSQVHTGMTQDEVHKLLGPSSTLTKGSDGSVTENWNSEYGNDQGMHVTFVDGKMTDKKLDDFGITDTKTKIPAVAITPAPTPLATPMPEVGSTATPAVVPDAIQQKKDAFYSRHSGKWTTTLSLPQGDITFRFDLSSAGATNVEEDEGWRWAKPDASRFSIVDVIVINPDYATVIVMINNGKSMMGVQINDGAIEGAIGDADQHYPVKGTIK